MLVAERESGDVNDRGGGDAAVARGGGAGRGRWRPDQGRDDDENTDGGGGVVTDDDDRANLVFAVLTSC